MGFLTEKVKEKPDPNSKTAIDFDSKVTAERDKQIKVIALNLIIIYTRPKPAYGRQGLASTFLVFSLRACGAQLQNNPTWDH